MWVLLEPCDRSEETACLVFRMIAKDCAINERTISRPHRSPPFKLFLIAQNRSVIPAVRGIKECLRGRVMTYLMSKYDLESEEMFFTILLILMLGQDDTAYIECLHALIRRFLTRNSVQTHTMGLVDVSAFSAAHKLISRLQDQRGARAWTVDLPASEDSAVADPPAAADPPSAAAHAPVAAKTTGAGGAWRDFVSEQRRSGIAMRDVGANYSDAEKQKHAESGAAATAAHRIGAHYYPSKRRDAHVDKHRRASALADRLMSADSRSSLRAVCQHDGGSASSAANASASLNQPFEEGQRAVDALGVGASVEPRLRKYLDVIRVVAVADSIVAKKGKALSDEEVHVLNRFEDTVGARGRAGAVADLSGEMRSIAKEFQMVPKSDLGGGAAFQYQPDFIGKASRALANADAGRARANNLQDALLAYWESAAEQVATSTEFRMPSEVEGGPAMEKETKCFLAGVCICCVEGRRLHQFRNRFYSQLKASFPRGSEGRDVLLDGGFVVCRFRSVPLEPFFPVEESEYAIEHCETVLHWFTVADLLYTPFEVTFNEMALVTDSDFYDIDSLEPVQLVSSFASLVAYDALNQLSLGNMRVSVRFYKLRSLRNLIIPRDEFRPKRQTALPLFEGLEECLWPPPRRRGGEGGARRGRARDKRQCTGRRGAGGRGRGQSSSGGRRGRGINTGSGRGDASASVAADFDAEESCGEDDSASNDDAESNGSVPSHDEEEAERQRLDAEARELFGAIDEEHDNREQAGADHVGDDSACDDSVGDLCGDEGQEATADRDKAFDDLVGDLCGDDVGPETIADHDKAFDDLVGDLCGDNAGPETIADHDKAFDNFMGDLRGDNVGPEARADHGAQASSGPTVELPPVPPPPVGNALRAPVPAVHTPYGKLSLYYNRHGKPFVECTCEHPNHGRCRITRSLSAVDVVSSEKAAAQGRPLGLMYWWLENASCCSSKTSHYSMSELPSQEQRLASRRRFAALGEGARLLLSKERPLHNFETEDEPEVPCSYSLLFTRASRTVRPVLM